MDSKNVKFLGFTNPTTAVDNNELVFTLKEDKISPKKEQTVREEPKIKTKEAEEEINYTEPDICDEEATDSSS